MHQQALRAYLEEHLVGARTLTHLVDRRLEEDDCPAWLEQFRRELEDERELLEGIAAWLGPSAPVPSKAAGVAAQAGVRGSLRVMQAVGTELRDLMEFETMFVGVQGKACLWRVLEQFVGHPALAGVELDKLRAQAEVQAQQLEELRMQASTELQRAP